MPTEYTSEEPTETLLTVSKFKEMVDAWEPNDNSGRALRGGEDNMEWLEAMKDSRAEENASELQAIIEKIRNNPSDQVGHMDQRGSGRSTNPLIITSEYGIEMAGHRLLAKAKGGKGGSGSSKGGKSFCKGGSKVKATKATAKGKAGGSKAGKCLSTKLTTSVASASSAPPPT